MDFAAYTAGIASALAITMLGNHRASARSRPSASTLTRTRARRQARSARHDPVDSSISRPSCLCGPRSFSRTMMLWPVARCVTGAAC